MKRNLVLLLLLLAGTENALALGLKEQIKQNVDEAKKSYEQLINKEPPRLWIHARTEQQRDLLQHIADWLKPLSAVKIEPVQIVKEGPKKTELRFFSVQDKADANELLKKLQKFFPKLELQDLSSEYGNMGLFESGHYELWLAPELKKITPPELPPLPIAPASAKPTK